MLSCNKDKVVIVTHRKRNNDHVLYDKDKKCPLALAGRKSSTVLSRPCKMGWVSDNDIKTG